MRKLSHALFGLVLYLTATFPSAGQTPGTPNLVKELHPGNVHFFAADTARHRIYGSVMASGTVVVIDTDTLSITKIIPVGPAPAGMSVSPDGLTLYVALSGASQVGVIDLTTLTASPPLTIAYRPWQVAAGLSDRLYITPMESLQQVLQVNALTGATEATVYANPYFLGLLQISIDRSTLYFGDAQDADGAALYRYDVTGATPIMEQGPIYVGGDGVDLKLDHHNTFICFAVKTGNNNNQQSPTTTLFNSMDFTMDDGNFAIGATPSFLTFSPGDRIVYEYGGNEVHLFDIATSAALATLGVPNDFVNDLITDATGRYLFVADPTGVQVFDLLADVTTSFYGTLDGLPVSFQAPIYIDSTTATATGLPSGFTFDSVSKIISGTPTEEGSFPVVVTASDGVHTVTANLSLVFYPQEQAANISTRADVQAGDNVLIAGFILTGNYLQDVVVRGIGPSLEVGGVPLAGRLDNPILTLYDSTGAPIGTNDNWQTDPESDLVVPRPTNPLEAALYRTLAPGAYTVIIKGVNNSSGIALAEVYAVSGANTRLANISTRADVQTGDDVMVGGIIITGTDYAKMLFRALGPSLAGLGLANTLQNPQLDLYDAQGTKIAHNDNWMDTQKAAIIATGLAPNNPLESAISISLAPAAYTAIVSGVDGTTGVGLVEAYNLP